MLFDLGYKDCELYDNLPNNSIDCVLEQINKNYYGIPTNEEKTKLQQQSHFEQVIYTLKDATDWAILTIAKDFEITGDRDFIINQIAQTLSKDSFAQFKESDRYLQSMVLMHNEDVRTTPEIDAEIQEFRLKSDLKSSLEQKSESPTVDECLAKVEEQEAAKSSVKTPSL